jgi:hypothetical protein
MSAYNVNIALLRKGTFFPLFKPHEICQNNMKITLVSLSGVL